MTKFLLAIFIIISLVSCAPNQDSSSDNSVPKTDEVKAEKKYDNNTLAVLPEWAKNANIYEVNIRQFTKEGTINAFRKHLDRIQAMGVDILWLMPIFPIGQLKKKGPIGSPYSVADYKKVNPDFGTTADFHALVEDVHKRGMHLILDWVPNHSSWDNPWIKDHPEWYTSNGDTIIHPSNEKGEPTDWFDVADLNYDNKEMRAAMIDALSYWVTEHDVDGYRCDVAFFVPDDFWADANRALRKLKHVFMLAESEHAENRNSGSFHMTYAWTLHHLLNDISKGKKNALDLDKYLKEDRAKFNKGFHMNFTSNHDENSWNGTVFERMGDAHKALAVLTFVLEGMPLIYGGQEVPLKKRLSFFDKDEIDWNSIEYADFYTKLLKLKKRNKALWNGDFGGKMTRINTGNDNVFAMTRINGNEEILAVFNLSNKKQTFRLKGTKAVYKNALNSAKVGFKPDQEMHLAKWGYMLLENN